MEISFQCPITKEIMINPYIDKEGNSFEYSAILEWLKYNQKSPITRNSLNLSDLTPNRALKDIIESKFPKTPVQSNQPIQTINTFKVEDNLIDSIVSTKTTFNNENYFKIDIKAISGTEYPPIDIVAVIDISGSMDSPALVEQDGKQTDIGYTILDITKQALYTIIESMKPSDRISVVVFSDTAEVIFGLTTANNINKDTIANLRTKGCTNIWAGLNIGLNQFTDTNRVSSLMFLTDGLPSSHLLPPRGILESLEKKLSNMTNKINIYTFGFGYSLDTELLINISKLGNGNFSFIPDSGFVGTIFIHALSHIYTTMINNLQCYYSDDVCCLGNNENLTTVHYGQSRTLIFKAKADNINIKIVYDGKEIKIDKFDIIDNTNEEFILHKMRLELVEALKITPDIKPNVLQYLNKYSHMENTIMEDFKSQVCLAIDNKFYNKWGKNYINSFREAHSQERCNNFKDKSIQLYGGKLFKEMKDKIDDIYTNMPPPKPSNVFNENTGRVITGMTGTTAPIVSATQFTRMFNNMNGGCFHPNTVVLMVGNTYKPIHEIIKGDQVLDIKGNIADVICLVKINCNNGKCVMVKIDDLIITPYHPIKLDDKWIFPKDLNIPLEFECDSVYNLVLSSNHTVVINNYISCTFGHNITDNDVIKHEYFGTNVILNDLKNIKGFEDGLVILKMNDFIRDESTGKIIKISSS
jgi:hypothetical protein